MNARASSSSAEGAALAASRRSLLPWYVGCLLVTAALIGTVSDHHRVAAKPLLFGVLVAMLLALDNFRIDIFERGNISPVAVPAVALAYLFGPFGPILGELAIASARMVRRDGAAIKHLFDLGCMSAAGVAAAGVFALVPAGKPGPVIAVSALAGLAYYAVNSALITVVWRLDEGVRPLAAFRERVAWLWPHTMAAGVVGGVFVVAERSLGPSAFLLFLLPMAMAWVAQKQYLDRSRTSVAELRRANQQLRGLLDHNRELLEQTKRTYLSTITSLARTIEAKDPYTGGHTERVADYALMLARELGFDEEQLRSVEVGAVIHDIGKIGIPDRILLKPGRLDQEEFDEMRKHPEISSYILGELELPEIVRSMARSHHERYDGKGYPDGLSGELIPLEARILSVADAFDAMTSDRPYRRALAPDVAVSEIRRNAGTQFCPRVVSALEVCLGRERDSGWNAA